MFERWSSKPESTRCGVKVESAVGKFTVGGRDETAFGWLSYCCREGDVRCLVDDDEKISEAVAVTQAEAEAEAEAEGNVCGFMAEFAMALRLFRSLKSWTASVAEPAVRASAEVAA